MTDKLTNDYCPLCRYIQATHFYGECNSFRAFDCLSCNGIVVAAKSHIKLITIKEMHDLMVFLMGLETQLNLKDSNKKFLIRTRQRKIHDHFHIHLYIDKEVNE